MAKMPQSDRIRTPEGRASYAFVFKPKANDAGDEQFKMTLLIPKSSEIGIRTLKDTAKAVGIAAFGPGYAELVKAGRARWPFRDGDLEQPDNPDYAGHVFLGMRNTNKPQIVDRNPEVELLSPEEFGSGDYCIATGRFFAYDQKGNKGVAFSLGNIQRTRRGVRLDNKVDARTEFDALPPDESTAVSTPNASNDFDL